MLNSYQAQFVYAAKPENNPIQHIYVIIEDKNNFEKKYRFR